MRTLQKAQIKGSETPRELIMESQLKRGLARVRWQSGERKQRREQRARAEPRWLMSCADSAFRAIFGNVWTRQPTVGHSLL
jgi:hypothetical protein